MKERPILFNTEMVRAILAGRKTQTRRLITNISFYSNRTVIKTGKYSTLTLDKSEDFYGYCPFGMVGDRLWVRETAQPDCPSENHYVDNESWSSVPEEYRNPSNVFYKSDANDPEAWTWKPSIHMPRWASRITLQIKNVRVERLQDISDEDAKAEGCTGSSPFPPEEGGTIYCMKGQSSMPSPRAHFVHLWESIAGEGSWDENPWVWVIEFGRI